MAALATLCAVSSGTAQLVGPGISAELARHRTATLSDIRYDLDLRVPELRSEPVTGVLDLRFVLSGPGPVILDFASAAGLGPATVDGEPVAYEASNGHLVLPAEAVRPGPNQVRIEFRAGDGPLNRHDDLLYTLLVPDRAHEVFPAFDQPDLKARYRLRLTVPSAWVAVANGQVEEREERGSTTTYRFRETEPLPTYLFAFAAGAFRVEEAERNGRLMRLYHRETEAENVARNVPTLFDLHAAALAWLEDYTGIPYPFGKFDFLAIPAFQYNGMEHPGAVLYRASSLFLEPAATRTEELGRASLIAHEVAHMWFGNLVTMRWFDDVWMKEVFANLMAAKIVHPSFPDLDHELRFFVAHYPLAYGVDRTAGANAIRQELENLDDAASLYGAIIYQKAPIVMRQLERLTGEGPFRQALRGYLADHAFGSAGWPELVAYLDSVAPLDVPAWSRAWVTEPGRPTVRAVREQDGVTLMQEDPRGRGLRWDQPLTVRVPHGDGWVERPVRLDRDTARVPLPPPLLAAGAPVLPNGLGVGYGLFVLDPVTRDALLRSLPALDDALARAVAWVALHELMLEGKVPAPDMLDLAARLVAVEEDELVAQVVLNDLTSIFWRWLESGARQAVAPGIEALLWERVEALDGASRKATFFRAWAGVASTAGSLERMERIWSGDQVVDGLPLAETDLTSLALALAAHGVSHARAILDDQEARIENPDRRDRFRFVRRAVDPDPAVRHAFAAGLADPGDRHREEWVVAGLRLFHHPVRSTEAAGHVRPALDLLRDVRDTGDIFFPQRWLDAVLGGHGDPAVAAVVREFIAAQQDYPPRLMEKLLQSADPLFRAAAAR